jgi:hypothetical protein
LYQEKSGNSDGKSNRRRGESTRSIMRDIS